MFRRDRKSQEIFNRIRLSVYAYSYEFMNISLVDDGAFDRLALQIDTTIDTGRADLDAWFRQNFDPSTGSWIYCHPEINKIAAIFWRHYAYSHTT